MAKIIFHEKEVEVPDGSAIKQACEQLGVPFGCSNGFCRTCEVTVLEGKENLSELSEFEKLNELPENNRLMCQCNIKKGTIRIDSKNI